MKLCSYGADHIKDLVAFANVKNLTYKDIVTILPDSSGTYTLIYFDEK